jgi:tetratricopeptide (TPR) repeat protein
MRFASGLATAVVAGLLSLPAFAQIGAGGIHGKVIDRDGKPVPNAIIRMENLATHQTDEGKTNKNGDYSIVGLFGGKYKAYVIVNGKAVMVKGEGTGNEIFISDTTDPRVNFDFKDAPTVAPNAPAAQGANAKEKAAADKKNNEEMKSAFNAGVAAMKANNFEEAVKQYQLAAEKDPGQSAIFGNLGLALSSLKKYDEAVTAYRKSLELKPDDAPTQALLSLSLANAGKIDESMKAVEEVGKLDPALAGQSYYNLGAILTNRGKSKEAVEMFKKAIAIDPKNAPSYYQLGIAYFASPDTIPQAIAAFQKYLELVPTGADAENAKQFIAAAKAGQK